MKLHKWWILAAMTSCISMIFIDITVLPVALPTIQRVLAISEGSLHWIINAYTLSLTIFVLAGGRFGDRFGHRRGFCIGLLIFAIASALCGLAYGEGWFIFSRALQGIGAALLIPSTSAIIIDSFPEHQRGKAMGIYVSVGSIFLAIGPFVGGMFTQYLTWRLVFWMNLPIALLGFILAMIFVPRSPKKPEHFDWLGFITFSLGLTCIVMPLMQIQSWGWNSALSLTLFFLGIAMLVLMALIDRQVKDPYVDFSLFRQKLFLGVQISTFFNQFVVMVTVFWSIFFQNVLEFTPAQAGLLNLLSNAPILLIAPLAGILLDRFGPRVPIVLGFSMVIGSLVWFLNIYDKKDFALLLTALIPFGCGMPMIFTPAITSAMSSVSPFKRGIASGTMMMFRQTGATLGLAIFGTLFLSISSLQFSKALSQNVETVQLDPEAFAGLLAQVPSSTQAFESLTPSTQEFVKINAKLSDISAFASINRLAVFVAVLGLGTALLLIHGKARRQKSASHK